MIRAFVGLGGNLGDRERTLRAAVDALAAEAGIEVAAVSTLRETDPVGVGEQPRFLNGAAELETSLGARELLDRLLAIEQHFGRVRTVGEHGPRTLDLDLLLYGDELIDEPGLTVPHPRLHERRFVLEPLAELAPGLVVPGRGDVESLRSEAGSAGGSTARARPKSGGYTEPACPTSTISTSTRQSSSLR